MKRFLPLLFLFVLPLFAQSGKGELHLTVTDQSGSGVRCRVELVSEADQYKGAFTTDDAGNLIVSRLQYGVYQIQIEAPGFKPVSKLLEIRSAIPLHQAIAMALASASTSITVNSQPTLIDPYRPGAISSIGSEAIENSPSSLPGRSLQDLVNSQPGWLYEGNAVLHPRGSEYQTQFVVDGIPLTDNRSPGFAPEIEADDVQSLTIYTAGIPAEYGRKMGGVVEVNTVQDAPPGFHGDVLLAGGSFGTLASFARGQYQWGKNTLGFSAGGNLTSRYLNPPVLQNYTNTGTTADFSVRYERDFTSSDRLDMSVRHALSRFQIPNELVQQSAAQAQNADNLETIGVISYHHIFSPDALADFHGMVRNNASNLWSNEFSTPVIAFQSNSFNEGYFSGAVSIHHKNQEWKAGVESDSIFLHERFSDVITDPSQFDPGTPLSFFFLGNRPDLEQSAFVQDLLRFGRWTLSVGLRWDHYQLIVNRNDFSPRLSLARYFPSLETVVHVAYDRVFQTPDFENILLSSSPQVTSLNPSVLRLPVEPSLGNYFEAGFARSFFSQFSLEGNVFYRRVNNFADDDQLLDTGVSFPIAFEKAGIYGAEGRVNLPHWRRLSGYVSYSYMVGSSYFPVTGGLFLGQDATNAQTTLSGRFWVSQDQRNTVRTRCRYEFTPRLWAAAGANYGSGLPVDFDGTPSQALAQFGEAVVDRVNFSRGRVHPSLSIDASMSAVLYKTDKWNMRIQADGENLNDRLNLIDFAGLFSGNAIAPSRSYALRLVTSF